MSSVVLDSRTNSMKRLTVPSNDRFTKKKKKNQISSQQTEYL